MVGGNAIESNEQRKRSVAIKIAISDIKALPFFKEEGWASSYLKHSEDQIIRISFVGTLIQKSPDNLSGAIDDGSGSIPLRVFEDKGMISSVDVGDVVLVIGKPREYSNERYVLPEIVKKVDSAWQKVWKSEISKKWVPLSSVPSDQKVISQPSQEDEVQQDPIVEEVESVEESPLEKVCGFIRSKDAGNGVDVQEIVESKVVEKAETLISTLLKNGDIFEIRPGRVKVLE